MTYAEIEEQARRLPPKDRARLAEAMLESLLPPPDPEIEAAWEREIERRIDMLERGEARTYSAEEVFAEARRRCEAGREPRSVD